jgi:sugar/nucleoside kinase (ribokinase family)
LAACIAHGKPLAETARLAIGAGALACTASETIHPGMSWENIRYILDKEEL